MPNFYEYEEFNGKTVEKVEVADYDVTRKVVVVCFTDRTKMRIEIKAEGHGFDFEEVTVNVSAQ